MPCLSKIRQGGIGGRSQLRKLWLIRSRSFRSLGLPIYVACVPAAPFASRPFDISFFGSGSLLVLHCPADIRDSRISPLARTFATATGARIARPADYTLQLSQRQVRGHSPALLPFLKCSLRDFEFQSCLALGKIAPRAPAVESLAQAIPDPASIMIRLGPFSTTHPALPPGEMPDTKQ
jgi:hypothetical protein